MCAILLLNDLRALMLLHDSVVFIVHLLLSTGQDTAQAGKSLGAWVFRLSQCFSVCSTASPWYCGRCDNTWGHAEALGFLMGYLTLLALMPWFLLTQLHSVSRLVFKEKLSNTVSLKRSDSLHSHTYSVVLRPLFFSFSESDSSSHQSGPLASPVHLTCLEFQKQDPCPNLFNQVIDKPLHKYLNINRCV